MPIDLRTIDLDSPESPEEIIPQPQVAVSDTDHRFSPIGDDARGILLDLLSSTDRDQPFGVRVFDRLGVDYEHAEWGEYDLYWVEGGDAVFARALMDWRSSDEMSGPATRGT